MKFTIKKITALVAAASVMVSAVAAFGSVSASAATSYVNLYETQTISANASTQKIERDVYVKTDSSSSNQKVYVHYDKAAGQAWADKQASYFKTLADGSKLWKATITTSNNKTEYVIKYVANGKTIWDNNNGRNYSGSVYTHDDLGVAPISCVRQKQPTYYFATFVTANLQNYAYHKKVFVRYSFDHWKTYKETPLTYDKTLDNGTEDWTGTFNRPQQPPIDGDYFWEYKIGYQVNGQTYWADNFGKNFNVDYKVK